MGSLSDVLIVVLSVCLIVSAGAATGMYLLLREALDELVDMRRMLREQIDFADAVLDEIGRHKSSTTLRVVRSDGFSA